MADTHAAASTEIPDYPFRRIPTLRLAAPIEQLAFDHTGTTYGVCCLPVAW